MDAITHYTLQDLAHLSQILQTLVVIGGFIYGKMQFDEIIRARKLEATRQLIKELGEEEIRNIRSWLMHEFNSSPNLESLKLEQKDLDKVKQLAVAYDRVGFLVSQKIVPEKQLYDFQKDEIKSIWNACKPIIMYIRTHGNRPGYCKHFEYLGEIWLSKMERKECSLFNIRLKLKIH